MDNIGKRIGRDVPGSFHDDVVDNPSDGRQPFGKQICAQADYEDA